MKFESPFSAVISLFHCCASISVFDVWKQKVVGKARKFRDQSKSD